MNIGKAPTVVTLAAIVVAALGLGLYLWKSSEPSRNEAATVLSRIPPLLADEPFPTKPVQYQPDWPVDLIFPGALVLVESRYGDLPSGNQGGRGLQLRFEGSTTAAADLLSDFMITKSWTVVSRNAVSAGGYVLMTKHAVKGDNGLIVIGPDIDNPGSVKVLVIVSAQRAQ